MACNVALKCMLSWLVFVVYTSASKYSKDANMSADKMKVERPFRMNKLNLFWEKANKKLKPKPLSELYSELMAQDKLELDAKRKRAKGFDEDGEHAAIIRDRLHGILERFGIAHYREESETNEWMNDAIELQKEGLKLDRKLGKLWKKAQHSGFTADQLKDLKKEFLHHQSKLEDYEQLRGTINQLEDVSDNSIQATKHVVGSEKMLKQHHKDLKTKWQDVQESYRHIETIAGAEERQMKVDFSDPKVVELWLLAKKSNFSQLQLDSFKVELKHFEHKLKKHKVFKQEAELSASLLASKSEDELIPDKHLKLEHKVEQYGRKIKKIHTDLKNRVEFGSRVEL